MALNVLQILTIVCFYSLFHLLLVGQLTNRHLVLIPSESIFTILHTNINAPLGIEPAEKKHSPNYREIVLAYLKKLNERRQRINPAVIQRSQISEYKILLKQFIDKLHIVRNVTLFDMLEKDLAWTFEGENNQRVIFVETNNHLNLLNQYKFVKTVSLRLNSIALRTFSSDVFDFSSNDCAFIDRYSHGKEYPSQDSRLVFGTRCLSDTTGVQNKKLEMSAFSAFGCCGNHSSGEDMVVSYIHILRNAFVNRHGDVHVKNFKLVPLRCQPNLKPRQLRANYLSKIPIFDEVFSVAQFWGDGYYHAVVEEMSRIAPYVAFLQRNAGIMIHVASRPTFLLKIMALFHIDSNRIVDGPVRARILYVPNGMQCGIPNAFNIQLLRLMLMTVANKYEPRQTRNRKREMEKEKVILIKRSSKRKFYHHVEIYSWLTKLETKFPVSVRVFSDDKIPAPLDTIKLFHDAAMILAPHGAGLTNMIFSKPKTIVIEAICYNNKVLNVPNKTFTKSKRKLIHALDFNLCYRNLAHVLGHQYFGLVKTDKHCNETGIEDLKKVVYSYLNKRYSH